MIKTRWYNHETKITFFDTVEEMESAATLMELAGDVPFFGCLCKASSLNICGSFCSRSRWEEFEKPLWCEQGFSVGLVSFAS